MALGNVSLRSVGDAQHVGESAAHQCQSVLLALGDDELADGFGIGTDGVDAVDAVGGAGLGGRLLCEVLGPFAGDGVEDDGAELHVDDLAVQVVAVGDGWDEGDAVRVLALPVVGFLVHVGAHHSRSLHHFRVQFHRLYVALHLVLQGFYFLGLEQRACLGTGDGELGRVEMLQELLAFLVAFQGVDGVEPGAHLLVDFLVVAGYHGHVVLVLLLVGFLLAGSGVVGSVDA